MTDDTADTIPALGAKILPAGSGVADLEIAREQDALASASGDPEAAMPGEDDDATEFADADDIEPTAGGAGAANSQAHPSCFDFIARSPS